MLCIPSYQASPGIWHASPPHPVIWLCVTNPSSHSLTDTGDTQAASATGHWPWIPRPPGLSALWLNDRPVTMKAASPWLSAPQLFAWDGRKDHRVSLPRGHSDAEKRVCLSAEAWSSLDNGHILLRGRSDTWRDQQGRGKSRQTAKRPSKKYPLKLGINTRGIRSGSGAAITKHPEAKHCS